MSESEPRDALRLARELADFPGAVPVLVVLFHNGGSARREVLTAATDPRHVDDALRWLGAERLISRSAGSGSFDLDQAGTSYELTAIGSSLTGSLIELAKVCSEPAMPAAGAAGRNALFVAGRRRCKRTPILAPHGKGG